MNSPMSLEESVEILEKYPSVTERYFTPRYIINPLGLEGEDHCILFHSNRICMVALAPRHPVLTEKKEIVNIDFQVSQNVNRLENKVSGKGKHGAQALSETALLCKLHCSDGCVYSVHSCIKGKLVEINENLIKEPNLLVTKPYAEGYIAIVLPRLGESDKQRGMLLNEEEYQAKLKEIVKDEKIN